MSVLLVMTNFKRRDNVRMLLKQYEKQSLKPDRIVIADNHPHGDDSFALSERDKLSVDDVYSMRENLGPPCRFVPAIAATREKYVLFVDDDFVPGPNLISTLFSAAEALNGDFATIGIVGRRFRLRGHRSRYVSKNVKRDATCVPVDMTCRLHLVARDRMWAAVKFRDELLAQSSDWNVREGILHDDMVLCLGIQKECGGACYLAPSIAGSGMRNIDHPHSFSARSTHKTIRSEFVRAALKKGWVRQWS